MSLEKKLRTAWGHVLAKASYPITGNFSEQKRNSLEERFQGVYNKEHAFVVSSVLNTLAYTGICGVAWGEVGLGVGACVGVGEIVLRSRYADDGSMLGSLMTAEEGTTWKERWKKKAKQFAVKWAIIGTLGLALAGKMYYDKDKFPSELPSVPYTKDQKLGLDNLLDQKEAIPILRKRIDDDTRVLATIPKETGAMYHIEPSFLDYYKQEVKPTLDEFLGSPDTLPHVHLGMYNPNHPSVIFDYMALASLGMLFFGLGVTKRMRYGIMSVYNFGKGSYALLDHRGVGVEKRLVAGGKILYHGTALLFHNTLALGNTLGLLLCIGGVFGATAKSANYYDPATKRAVVAPVAGICETKDELAIVLAHESVHYWQDKKELPWNSPLWEGYARALEIKVAEEMARKTKNQKWLRASLKREKQELEFFHDYLVLKYGDPHQDTLFFTKDQFTKEDKEFVSAIYAAFSQEGHIKGISLFRVAEHYHGPKLYDAVQKGDLTLLSKK